MITIQVNTGAGETLNSVLAGLGLMALPRHQHEQSGEASAFARTGDFALLQRAESCGADDASTGLVVGNDVPPPTILADTGAGRKRRTKAEMEESRLAAEAKAHAESLATTHPGQPQTGVWEVRRYDGRLDADFPNERLATERLIELVNNAGDLEALASLTQANTDLVNNIGREWAAQIREAVEAVNAALSAPKGAAPAPSPAPSGVTDIEGNPLTAVTADKRGAQNVIRAIASGPPPTYGFIVAKALLEKHGTEKVSALPDGDAKHALIAAEGAALLGLPMVGNDAGGLV